MKQKIKLYLRKRALMLLGAIVWRLDDWLHRQQVKLRKEIEFRTAARNAVRIPAAVARPTSGHCVPAAQRQPETFLQWEARKSGVAVITKKEARHRRDRLTSTAFDRRFA